MVASSTSNRSAGVLGRTVVLGALALCGLESRGRAQGTWSPLYDWSSQFGPTAPTCAYGEISHAALISVGHYKGMVLLWHHVCSPTTTGGEAQAWIFNPADPTQLYLVSPTTLVDVFCSGQSWNSDGKLITAGGLTAGSLGYKSSFLFDPTALGLLLVPQFPGTPIVQVNSNPWVQLANLSIERYYPTVIALNRRNVSTCGSPFGSGHLVLGGPPTVSTQGNEHWELIPQTNPTCTLTPPPPYPHTVGGNTQAYVASGNPDTLLDSYPRAFQLSNDDVFVAHDVHTVLGAPNQPGQSWVMHPDYGSGNWTLDDGPDAGTTPPNDRDYGNAVLMHMQNGLDRIFALGGSQDTSYPTPPATIFNNATLQEFVPGANPPSTSQWITHTPTGRNPSGRKFANSVLLPTGKIMVVGGTATPRCYVPVFNPVIYTPGAPGTGQPGHGSQMSAPAVVPGFTTPTPRFYHSLALLLPDASVFVAGGEEYTPCSGPSYPSSKYTGEVFTPPYPSYRPTIQSVTGPFGFAPGVTSFTVQATTVQGAIEKVVLLRPGAVTHHFDSDQRYIELAFTPSTTTPGPVTLTVTPPTDNLGPAGHYMLFVLEHGAQGLAPSVTSKTIQIF